MRAPPELLRDLRGAVESAVERNRAEAILLSGGLDTSIVAALASKHSALRAYTIALEGAPSPDIEYANLMAKALGLNHDLHTFSVEEFMQNLPEVVKTLKVFDLMRIKNSLEAYIAIRKARKDVA